jgi:hypothetical protein
LTILTLADQPFSIVPVPWIFNSFLISFPISPWHSLGWKVNLSILFYLSLLQTRAAFFLSFFFFYIFLLQPIASCFLFLSSLFSS